ncbi:alpha/beta hydrolase [Reichenbachiella agariperforans]|uniref:alpha/beta hydrolase n=1 Tax=Reichenbachiella agariperforans TaxID=156994 RepID=UPI00338E349B
MQFINFSKCVSPAVLITVGLLLLGVLTTWGQGYPRDTSYTVNSAYTKYKKKFPQIEIAKTLSSVRMEEGVVYRSIGARDLALDIFYPKDTAAKHPLVVMVHGGGWVSGTRDHMHPLASRLAGAGFVAATVSYRLSPEAVYPAAVHDIKFAIRWLKMQSNTYAIDSSQVAILGCSAGGQLAALVGLTAMDSLYGSVNDCPASDKVQAMIDMDGVLAFHHPESAEGRVAGLWLGGSYEEVPAIWEEASALNHASAEDPPCLFINSSTPRFHAGQDDLIAQLSAFDIYTEVHQIADTPHTFWLFDPWLDPTTDWIVDFLYQMFEK